VPGTKLYILVKLGAGIPIKYVDKIRYDIMKLCEKNSIFILRSVNLMLGNEKINIIKEILTRMKYFTNKHRRKL
jgi:hypothetical protein